MLRISQLFIYPVKSLAGIAVKEAMVTDRGFQYDRRWMLIDRHNRFLSQRELAEMALLDVEILNDGLQVRHRVKGNKFKVPFEPQTTQVLNVTVWDDQCTALHVCNEADNWFSKMLGINCKLVYMPDNSQRPVELKYAHHNEITSFSDAYPFLLIGQSSMDDLNSKLKEAVTVERFRPNMVFTGGFPFQEDELSHFTLSGIDFYGVKPCARCNIPAIDPVTALTGKEPAKTLATYRRRNNNIYFGQNLLHRGCGMVKAGDELVVQQPL